MEQITCSDGEILLAKVHAVSDEDEDVICDLVSTTMDSTTRNVMSSQLI